MRILLLLVATFAVGLLAGSLLLHEQDGGRRRVAAAPESTAAGRETPRADRRSEPRADEAAAPRSIQVEPIRGGDLGALAGEAAAELERVVSTDRVQSVLHGDGVVSGTVRDPAGEPVAGVIVTAVPEAQPFGLAASARRARERGHEDRDLSDVTRDAIQSELWRRAARHVGTSRADGLFELKGLADVHHRLTAYHDDFEVKPLQPGQERVTPDAVVDFVARPTVEVRVEVRLPDGPLADHAWLTWEGPHGRGGDTWTEEQGTVRLPVGPCKVKAQSWLPEPMESDEVEQTFDAGGAGEVLVLELKGRRVLTARLVPPEGFVQPPNVEYRLRRLAERDDVDPESLLQDDSARQASAPSPGRAYWYDLEPGRYLVAAFVDRQHLIAHAVAEVGDGPAEVDLPIEAPGAGECVTVKLLGTGGGPVPGRAWFAVVAPKYQRVHALQRGDGAWAVFVGGIDAQERSGATLQVYAGDRGSARCPLPPTGGTATIRFDEPARLVLHIGGYAGSGVEGALRGALSSDTGAGGSGRAGPDGTCRFSAVQPGSYRLQLYVRRRSGQWPILQRTVHLDSGEKELPIDLPTLHTLRIRVRGPVTLRSEDASIGNLRVTGRPSGGVVTFESLAAGSYEVEYRGNRVSVRVPSPELTLE